MENGHQSVTLAGQKPRFAPLTARGVPCGGGAAGAVPAPLTARGVPCGGGAAGSCPLALAVCRPCGCVCGLSKKKGRGRCAPALCGLRVQLFGVKPRASAFFWTCSTVFAIALCVTPKYVAMALCPLPCIRNRNTCACLSVSSKRSTVVS